VRDVQDIVFGVTGQSVYFDAPEGRPSSVTSCEVFWWDSADDSAVLTGSGAVETNPNTTIDAASGLGLANPRLLYVTATTGITVGRSYLVTSADGASEWFDAAEVDSGNYVLAKHPLHNAYTTADTVQTTRITATVDSTWVADEENLDETCGPNPSHRVRWVYVVGGVTKVADSYFRLVRYAGKHGVRPSDLEALAPGWLDRLPTDHYNDQGRRLIDEAYRAVKLDLHQVWTDATMVANSEVIDELTRYKAMEIGEFARLYSGGGSRDSIDAARAAYSSRFDQLARITSKIPIRTVDGGATHVSALPLTRR
jgi:hypothetical protein